MAGIQVDHGWIASYASTADQSGDELADALRTLQGSPLTTAAFGDLGRTVGSADAYHAAAATLQQQLARAADAMHAAATNLRTVAAQHSSADEQQATAIKSTHQI